MATNPAPSPQSLNVTAPPPNAFNGTDLLGTCQPGQIACYKNEVSDNQIVTALWVSIVVGVVALLLFAALRSRVQTYRTRENMASVWIKPPKLPVGGLDYLWSWLYPLFTTSDAQLIHTAGLDALMLSWICSMGIQIFLPLSILGAVMLLPINLSGHRVENNLDNKTTATAASSTFSKLTVSNIERGSGYYWIVFVFVYIVTAYVCWVLIKYYQAYVILRQHYLIGGENLVNEWHLQYLAEQEAAEKAPSQGGRTLKNALATIRNILDPSNQAAVVAERMEEAASVYSAYPTHERVTVAGALANARAGGSFTGRGEKGDTLSVLSGHKSNGTLASNALRSRRLGDRVSPGSRRGLPHPSPITPGGYPAYPSFKSQASHAKSSNWGEAVDAKQKEGASIQAAGGGVPPRLQEMGHRREGSELTREVLEAAGMAPSHEEEDRAPAGEVVHEPGPLNPGGGGLRSALHGNLRGRHKSRDASMDASVDEEQHVTGRSTKSVRFFRHVHSLSRLRGVRSRMGGKKDDVLASQELMDPYLERSHSLPTAQDLPPGTPAFNDPQPIQISKYERDAPLDTDREHIFRWWRYAVDPDYSKDPNPIPKDQRPQAGKPNVSFRKIVAASVGDSGEKSEISVNAQSYTVLVMDVPDINKERRRAVKRAARKRWWWRVWYRFVAFVKVKLMLRKDVDRRTGDFIMPVTANLGRRPSGTLPTDMPQEKRVSDGGSVELSSIQIDKEAGRVHIGPAAPQQEANGTNGTLSAQDRTISIPRTVSEGPTAHNSLDLQTISPKSMITHQTLEDEQSQGEEEGDAIDSEILVRETFKTLFPDSFDGVLPIRKHKEVDLLLAEWNTAWHKLVAAEAKYEKSGEVKRPQGKTGCCGCTGAKVDLIDHWAKEIRRLEVAIVKAREVALTKRARTSYFVFFTSQKDAAIAAQVKLHPEDGHSFQVQEAPGPEEVNWQTLWMPWSERDFRGIVTLLPLAVLIVFPIGLFSGAVNQATVAVCNGNKFFNIFYSGWYCKKSSLARSLVTGVLPSVLLMLWQNLVMPNAVYRIAQQQGASPSLSHLDRRIGIIFYVWDVFNVFLGAMLGGSIFSQLGILINNPGQIAPSIGTALPTASNFFINYIVLQAFATQTVRMLLPHLGVIPEFFRLCKCCMPKHDLQRAEALSPHSIRYGREIGAILLIYVIAMAYAATSPIILPFTLLYFALAWIHWRYNILYVSERCYESGGRCWDLMFTCMVWTLFLFELFTGLVLLSNSAYAQATILWITMTPMLYKFNSYCEVRYGNAVRHMPLETASAAPTASIPAVVYMPPALRQGAAGWYPEFGKAWENFGMPSYTW